MLLDLRCCGGADPVTVPSRTHHDSAIPSDPVSIVVTMAGVVVHPTFQADSDIFFMYEGTTTPKQPVGEGTPTQAAKTQGMMKMVSYPGAVAAVAGGVGFALTYAVMNGLSKYLFNGDTISDRAVAKFGGAN